MRWLRATIVVVGLRSRGAGSRGPRAGIRGAADGLVCNQCHGAGHHSDGLHLHGHEVPDE